MKTDLTFFKKATAVFLCTLFFCLGVLSFLGVLYAAETNFYTSSRDQLLTDTFSESLTSEAYRALDKYISEGESELFDYYENTNFRVIIRDEEQNILFSNLQEDDTSLESVQRSVSHFVEYVNGEAVFGNFTVEGYMIRGGDNLFAMEENFTIFIFAMRFVFIGLVAVFLAGVVISFVYLLFAAGKHRKGEEVRMGPIEKCPFDLYVLIYLVVGFLAIYLLDAVQYSTPDVIFFVILGLVCVCGYLLLLGFFMSIAIRLKTGTLWRNTLIYIVFSFIGRTFAAFFRMIPLVWKTLLVSLLICFTELFGAILFENPVAFRFLFFKNMALVPLSVLLAYHFRKLKKGAEAIKDGNYDVKIDDSNMFSDFKSMAATLESIGDGLSDAVEHRMKSERMKTELITNVSHDIKTPLTSIINYTDLLKKEDIQNETAAGYIEVIDRQAIRLKKLITDLVEASKASTGNIQVNPEKCDIAVLLEQAVGEYDEKFKAAALIPVLRVPEEALFITADGRLIWRVFDNLLSNICKYSLSGTRVYLDAASYGENCVISFKNISKTELNVSPDELLERFVRADSSRSTEGNGLGLSIAKSLTELMGAELEILSDGDLFKVRLIFPLLKA